MKTLLATLLVVIAGAAAAQEPICRRIEAQLGNEPLKMLAFLDQASCLGDDNDSDAITQRVRALLRKKQPEEALRQVAEYVHAAAGDRQPASQAVLAALELEVESVRGRLRAQQPLGEQHVKCWEWDKTRFRGLPSVNPAPLEVTCAKADEPPCREAAEAGKAVFRAASLVRQTLQFTLSDVYEQALAATRVRKAKWDAYFDDARVQFPWELYVNGWFYGRENRRKGGFAEPPNDQFIFLHPGIGVEYVGGAPSGNRFEAALVLELIGYNRWSWTKAGKIDNAWGASIIQTYSDRAGMSSMRPGVMLHYQSKYSVAFTRKNGETGVVLSVDLAKLVTKVEEDTRETFMLGK
jgi:hypothetical protein